MCRTKGYFCGLGPTRAGSPPAISTYEGKVNRYKIDERVAIRRRHRLDRRSPV